MALNEIRNKNRQVEFLLFFCIANAINAYVKFNIKNPICIVVSG
jgi:hypothetical protein